MYKSREIQKKSLIDMQNAIYRNNLDKLRTLLSLQRCRDAQTLRNSLLYFSVKHNKKEISKFFLQIGSNPNSGVRSSKPLHIAARNGNLGIMEILLNHGADINAEDDDGVSPLVYAIENKKVHATQLLLQRGARLFSDSEGRSPLHNAAKTGSLKIIKMLLQNGAPVNAITTALFEKGYTPLHCACSLSRAEVDIDIIEFLLSNGADVHLMTENGLTPLHIASEMGNVQVINLLLNHNSDIDGRKNDGYSPLYLAINRGNEDAALLLINRGAKLNDESCYGYTILGLALIRGLSSTVEEILNRCSEPQSEIEKSKNVFQSLTKEMINILLKYCFYIEFFHIAIEKGYIQIIESVLKDRLDFTANFDVIRTSVHIAVTSRRIESVEVLIAHGADVNAKDVYGMTPLFWTSSYIRNGADVKIAKMLLAAGADVNLRDENGETALHFAASKCRILTKFLLENKATVNSKDLYGCTALHIAIRSTNHHIVKILLKFGADINIKNKNNDTPMDILNRGGRYNGEMYDLYCLTLNHALALEAINLYYAKDLRSSILKLEYTNQKKMESHFENCKQEIEKLKLVMVPGYKLNCYALMMRSIHSLASYVKNEDLITHFASDDITTEFPIYAPIILGRLRNAFQRRPLTDGAGDFFHYYFQLPHVCVDHILSCLSSNDLMNVKDAM